MKYRKMSNLQMWLALIFVTAHVVSNITTVKQVALPFGLTTTAGVFVFPITYILSDVFSEVYGYKFSRVTCYASFAMNMFATAAFALAIAAPFPVWYDGQGAFAQVLGNTPKILLASMAAFVVGDFVNDKVFEHMKRSERHGFPLRAILSSVCGQIVDSSIFIPIAFFGSMPVADMLLMMALEIGVKSLYEIVVVPVTSFVAKSAARYEAVNEWEGRRKSR